jgi:hypothetical protein
MAWTCPSCQQPSIPDPWEGGTARCARCGAIHSWPKDVETPPVAPAPPPPPEPKLEVEKTSSRVGCMWGCLVLMLIGAAGIAVVIVAFGNCHI